MDIKTVKIIDLKPHPRNPRVHPESQISKLVNSLKEFGWAKPVVVSSDNYILAGHGCVEAAKQAGHKKVPVSIMPYKAQSAQGIGFMLADNRIEDDAEDDLDVLKKAIEELKEFDFDISLAGFEDIELDDLLNDPHEESFDVDAEVGAGKPIITKSGDLLELGRHRLLCGDSTIKADVERLMDGKKADMVFTDPPYGVSRDKGFGGFVGFGGFGQPIARRKYQDDWDSDRPPKDCFDKLMDLAQVVLIFGGNYFADILPKSTHWLVWDKLNTMPTFGDCELIWTNSTRKSVKKVVFEYNGLLGKEKTRSHPTQKPVGLLVKIIAEYEAVSVCDPFLGSGTTLIACEQLNRTCYGMEIDPRYCDVIVRRYIDYVGADNAPKALVKKYGEREGLGMGEGS